MNLPTRLGKIRLNQPHLSWWRAHVCPGRSRVGASQCFRRSLPRTLAFVAVWATPGACPRSRGRPFLGTNHLHFHNATKFDHPCQSPPPLPAHNRYLKTYSCPPKFKKFKIEGSYKLPNAISVHNQFVFVLQIMVLDEFSCEEKPLTHYNPGALPKAQTA